HARRRSRSPTPSESRRAERWPKTRPRGSPRPGTRPATGGEPRRPPGATSRCTPADDTSPTGRRTTPALEFGPCIDVDQAAVANLVELELRDAPARNAELPISVVV